MAKRYTLELTLGELRAIRFALDYAVELSEGWSAGDLAGHDHRCHDRARGKVSTAKRVTGVAVAMTRAEARNLHYAAGNVMEAACDVRDVFPEAADGRAAMRGYRKLRSVAWEVV